MPSSLRQKLTAESRLRLSSELTLAVGVSGLETEGLLRPEASVCSEKESSSGTSGVGLMADQGRDVPPLVGIQKTDDEGTAMDWPVPRLRTRITS